MNNPIGILLKGGLGNQLFQIFTLLSTAIDNNKDYYILHNKNDKRELYKNLYLPIINKITSNYYNISENDENIYLEKKSREYSKIPENKSFLIGHFESPKYFNHNKNKIINILKLNELQFKYKFNFKKIIAIHFRFEDCINVGYIEKPLYYINALNILKEELKEDYYNYKFIIFSSNGVNDSYLTEMYLKEINENLEKPIDFILFKNLYPNVSTEEEFLYMSNSNYFIISASTFSWFAYYLCPYNDKKIIISNEWFNEKDNIELYEINGIIKNKSIKFKDREIYEKYNI